MKLIDADKLREQLGTRARSRMEKLIDEAPNLALTWEDVRELVRTADAILTRETGKYPTEQSYYEEVLKRFNEQRK